MWWYKSLDFYKSGMFTLMWEIRVHAEVRDWLLNLDKSCREECDKVLLLLGQHGPRLGRPAADHIKGSVLGNLKELRANCSKGRKLRMLFAFDPHRQAIVLVAGDKKGEWNSWYPRQIRLAEQRYLEHLMEPGTTGQTTFPAPEST